MLLKTKNYIKQYNSLPKKEKVLTKEQEKLLIIDIYHNKLHTKKLQGFLNDKVFSFRITIKYRGIFRLDNEKIILFGIGHRKDIYK